jgi:hypothetical protein
LRENNLERRKSTQKKKLVAEQIVTKQRKVEVMHSQDKSVAVACKDPSLSRLRSRIMIVVTELTASDLPQHCNDLLGS